MKGFVNTYCDRCGDSLSLNLVGEETYYVKQKSNDKEVDNVIFITHTSEVLNLKGTLIETLFFLIPKRRVHEASKCDVEALKKLDSYQEKEKNYVFQNYLKTKKK